MSYFISTEKSLLNIEKIHSLLRNCFWCKNIPLEYVERFVKYSLCFGIYPQNTRALIGFARVISDFTTYAYVCDLIIDPDHRKKGLATRLIKEILSHPDLQGLKTWSLRTSEEAQAIYKKLGFMLAENSDTILEINDLDIYLHLDFMNLYEK